MLVLSGLPRGIADEWVEALAEAAPQLEVAIGPVETGAGAVEAMLTWKPPKGEISRYPNLRFITSGGAGADGILADPDLPPDLPVVRLVDDALTARMTAYVVHAVLQFHRGALSYAAAQAARTWSPGTVQSPSDTRVGTLGLGALGTDAAQKLGALGFSVGGWSRTPKEVPGVKCHHGKEGLGALLACTDVLVLLLPLTSGTRNLLDAAMLSHLPEGAALVNPARGALIVEDDLLAALNSGHLSGAALDVFVSEPLPATHPFWTHLKVILTPHIASRTDPVSAAPQVFENLRRARAGEALLNRVDRDAGY